MIIKKILSGVVFLGTLAIGQVMAGPLSLQNATVTGTFNTGGFADGATQVVDDLDFEFLTDDSNHNQFFFIDFNDAGLVSVYNNVADSGFVSPPNQILLFNFSDLVEPVVGVSPVDGLNLSVLGPNSIEINLSSVVWGDPFTPLSAQLVFASASAAVPEPGSLALISLAMASLVALRRRKQ